MANVTHMTRGNIRFLRFFLGGRGSGFLYPLTSCYSFFDIWIQSIKDPKIYANNQISFFDSLFRKCED